MEIKVLLRLQPHISLENVMNGTDCGVLLDNKNHQELMAIIENIKLQIGIYEPYSNAKGLVSITSNQIQRKFQMEGLTQQLLSDNTLLSLIEQYIPSSHWLSPPLHILYRVYMNVEKWSHNREMWVQDLQRQQEEDYHYTNHEQQDIPIVKEPPSKPEDE